MIIGSAYLLTGLNNVTWGNTHPRYGRPDRLAVVYLGSLQGTRAWHLCEVRVAGADAGVLLIDEADFVQITITPL